MAIGSLPYPRIALEGLINITTTTTSSDDDNSLKLVSGRNHYLAATCLNIEMTGHGLIFFLQFLCSFHVVSLDFSNIIPCLSRLPLRWWWLPGDV